MWEGVSLGFSLVLWFPPHPKACTEASPSGMYSLKKYSGSRSREGCLSLTDCLRQWHWSNIFLLGGNKLYLNHENLLQPLNFNIYLLIKLRFFDMYQYYSAFIQYYVNHISSLIITQWGKSWNKTYCAAHILHRHLLALALWDWLTTLTVCWMSTWPCPINLAGQNNKKKQEYKEMSHTYWLLLWIIKSRINFDHSNQV